MQNIANGERCLAKTIANNILELNGVEPIVEEVLYPEPSSEERTSKPQNSDLVSESINNTISINPNPANEFVLINLPQEAYTITVYNSSGQITELQQSNGQAKISVNTSSYAEGLYLIRLQGIKTQQDYKVSIKH